MGQFTINCVGSEKRLQINRMISPEGLEGCLFFGDFRFGRGSDNLSMDLRLLSLSIEWQGLFLRIGLTLWHILKVLAGSRWQKII